MRKIIALLLFSILMGVTISNQIPIGNVLIKAQRKGNGASMSNIEQNLAIIKSAIYGEDVRDAIHDAIEDCYEDGKAGTTDLTARERIAATNSRVDNIIAQSGTSDTEVVDARTGRDGTVHSTLKARLDSEVADLKSALSNDPVVGKRFPETDFTPGYYQSNGIVSSSSNWSHALEDISGINASVLYSYGSVASDVAVVCFFDENQNLITYFSLHDGLHAYYIPSNARYIGLSAHNSNLNCFFLGNGYVTDLSNATRSVVGVLLAGTTAFRDGYYQADGTISPSTNWRCTLVNISNRDYNSLYIINSTVLNQFARICFFDESMSLLSSEPYNVSGTAYAFPSNTVYAGLTVRNLDEKCNFVIKGFIFDFFANESSSSALYVSPSGNDSNSGLSKSTPLATVNAALSKGASTVLLASGVYEQRIDLSLSKADKLLIKRDGQNQDTITFVDPDGIMCTSASLVSGSTKVYSAPVSINLGDQFIWIFQDGVEDESTLIPDAERMPQQRGYRCRCADTKLDRCSATTVSAALTEIENASDYKWFLDSDNSILYFSSPSNDFVSHPICTSLGSGLFTIAEQINITMIGIDVKYMHINLIGLTGATLVDCKCTNAQSLGGFYYDYAIGAKFIHCEAARIFSQRSYGDGFNAHGANSSLSVPARNCSTSLIDCWSHDNCDDGFSDHERAESFLVGGLYEYNGDGVTPSSGSHCSCYGVYSRRNGHGINYCIASGSSDKGIGGQMHCVNCVSENNTISGFEVTADGNKMILNNCKSIGNAVGYKCAANTNLEIIDCGSLNDTIVKSISGTLTVKNTTLVE